MLELKTERNLTPELLRLCLDTIRTTDVSDGTCLSTSRSVTCCIFIYTHIYIYDNKYLKALISRNFTCNCMKNVNKK